MQLLFSNTATQGDLGMDRCLGFAFITKMGVCVMHQSKIHNRWHTDQCLDCNRMQKLLASRPLLQMFGDHSSVAFTGSFVTLASLDPRCTISNPLWVSSDFIPMLSSATNHGFLGRRPFCVIYPIHCFKDICSVCPHIAPLTFRQRPNLQRKVSLAPLSHMLALWHSLKLEKQGLVLGACWG